jgi:hypothetical protein
VLFAGQSVDRRLTVVARDDIEYLVSTHTTVAVNVRRAWSFVFEQWISGTRFSATAGGASFGRLQTWSVFLTLWDCCLLLCLSIEIRP